jgi:hypothetical protein
MGIACLMVVRACSSGGEQGHVDYDTQQKLQAWSAQIQAQVFDEQKRQKRIAEENEKAAQAKAAHDALVAKYAAMKPWERAAAVGRICSPSMQCKPPKEHRTVDEILRSDDDCCPSEELAALVDSVRGTPEEGRLRAATDAAKKRHDAAVKDAQRSAKCCDGTLSDSCLCRDIHQGCCSHHGGVCGCE